jgi:dTDP-4-amino-4,6-dideoxygalactose transaminase
MPESTVDSLKETIMSGYLAEGDKSKEFTSLVQNFIGNPFLTTVNSCTMALNIAYRLSGVVDGSEVITTPLTSIASNVPVISLGGKVVWADVEKDTGMIDPNLIEGLVTERTKAVLVLHKDGDLAKINEITEICKKYRIKVIEDSAHAFGAKYKGVKIGNTADYSCFSFQAIKHITCADGGALSCANEADYKIAKKLKWFGSDKTTKGDSNPWLKDIDVLGYKGDLNNVMATIGISQMEYVDEIISKYNKNGNYYNKLLSDIPGLNILTRIEDCYSVYWAYTVLVEERDALIRKLNEKGILSMQIHPRNDKWTIFKDSKKELPGVDYFNERELSLPCGWWVDKSDIEWISSIIKEGW